MFIVVYLIGLQTIEKLLQSTVVLLFVYKLNRSDQMYHLDGYETMVRTSKKQRL